MKTIHPLELEDLLAANQPVEIVDVRARRYFEQGHIAGAHSLPLETGTLETLIHSRELPPTEPLYIVSRAGLRAQLVAEQMEQRGLTMAVVVEGGMQAWQRHGLPVDRSRDPENRRMEHHKRMLETGVATDLDEPLAG